MRHGAGLNPVGESAVSVSACRAALWSSAYLLRRLACFEDRPEPAATGSLPVIHRHAAGIDVGHQTHDVCVDDDPQADVRHFGSFSDELRRMADWLERCGVTTVAMES